MNEKRNRVELIAKRNLLFERFLESPVDIHLAVDIKVIDDKIAESTERIRAEDRKAQLREEKSARLHESSSKN